MASAPAPVAAVEEKVTAEKAKPDKKKKDKPAAAEKPEKKPQVEEEAVHVGRWEVDHGAL